MTKRRARVVSNIEFIKIYTISFGIQPVADPKFDSLYFSHDEDNFIIGQALLDTLNSSRTLQENDPEYNLLCWNNLENTRYKTDFENELYNFKYKNKISLYKNMQSCLVDLENKKIILSPFKHNKPQGWDGIEAKYDLIIPSSSPPEVIGAAVKYSIARCIGKGANLVAQKLFPDGVPDTFEDYLKSLNLQEA
jgi:hypothetical protein